jgi:hypothetical protein
MTLLREEPSVCQSCALGCSKQHKGIEGAFSEMNAKGTNSPIVRTLRPAVALGTLLRMLF